MDKQTLKTKLKQQAKQIAWRAITTVILTLTAVVTVWVYAAFVEPGVGPNSSDQDFAQNILGNNDANNDFTSTSVVANADGSLVERQEYLQTQINTNLNATVSSRALDSEVGDASDAASIATTLFAGQQAIFDQTKRITAYLTSTTRSAAHNCDNTPSTCCASGYHLCYAYEIYGANIEISGTNRNISPGNILGDVRTDTNTQITDCSGWTGDSNGQAGWYRASCRLVTLFTTTPTVLSPVECVYGGMDGFACYSNRLQPQWCCSD